MFFLSSYVAYINVVTLFTSSPALTVVFLFFCLFLVLVSAAFLANKDVYKTQEPRLL